MLVSKTLWVYQEWPLSPVWWCTHHTHTHTCYRRIWEDEPGRLHKFQAGLGYIVRLCFKNNKLGIVVCTFSSSILEAEAGESL